MEIKYYVRTTGEREFKYDLEYETITDAINKPVQAFIEALYKISSSNAVLLEDDLVLCNNFKEEIEKVIEQYPNDIINFFTKPELYFTTHYTDRFDYNQCTYFPKGIATIIADEISKIYNPNAHRSWASLTNRVLQNMRINHLIYRPALVQHKDNLSILQNGANLKRNTMWYKGYLDEVGCPSMDKAFSKEYYSKLAACLARDREIWDNEAREILERRKKNES